MDISVVHCLKKIFGFDCFRHGQETLVGSILRGNDVLGVLPTGGGKSLCYQLPAVMLEGVTIVISPLISLMKDQVDGLKDLGISTEVLNTSLDLAEYRAILNMVQHGEVKLLYISPERLENEYFITESQSWDISMIAVDEAHCVSQWGHDFRPSYKKIDVYIQNLPRKPIVAAFTATATPQVQQDIKNQLNLDNPIFVVNSFDRPNICFKTKSVSSKKDFLKANININQSSIVYCNTRKAVEEVYEFLKDNGFSVVLYHAGLAQDIRKRNQDAFMNDSAKIIVATNAFGMGIDKPDIRNVFHYNMPKNLESYYQEAGRAGRDGFDAQAVLLYSKQDFATAKFLIRESKEPFVHEKLNKMIAYCNSSNCLRKVILEYFGEGSVIENCNNCSSCKGEYVLQKRTIEAQKILSCIYRMKQGFGVTLICDVLRGSKNKKVFEKGFEQLSTYGIMKDFSVYAIKSIIMELLTQGFLYTGEYNVLKLTHKSKEILISNCDFFMKESINSLQPKKYMSYGYYESIPNIKLYEKLKALRFELARKANVPVYIIFSNSSLMDMSASLPISYDEFLKVEGVGEKKLEKYGDVFLASIKEFLKIYPNTEKVRKIIK